jgi:hypothetical protein
MRRIHAYGLLLSSCASWSMTGRDVLEHGVVARRPKLIAKPARMRIWLPSTSIAAVSSGQPSSSAMPLRVSASLGQRSRASGTPSPSLSRVASAKAAARWPWRCGPGRGGHLLGAGAGVLLQERRAWSARWSCAAAAGLGHAPEAREGVEGEVRPHEVGAALEPVLRARVEGREVVRRGLIELTEVALGGPGAAVPHGELREVEAGVGGVLALAVLLTTAVSSRSALASAPVHALATPIHTRPRGASTSRELVEGLRGAVEVAREELREAAVLRAPRRCGRRARGHLARRPAMARA